MSRWPAVSLAAVCDINPKQSGAERLRSGDKVSFVPMAAVDEVTGQIVNNETRRVESVTKGYTPFRDADVLFAKITPCMENGKAAIARGLVNGVGFGSTEFHVLRARADVLPEWILAFIRQPAIRDAAKASFTGTAGQQRVPAEFLKQITLPLPPLPEQERMVRILDEAEALRRLRTQSDRRADALRISLFKQMFGDPRANPREWALGVLGDVIHSAKDGPHVSPKYAEAGIPFLSTRNVRAGQIVWDDLKYISAEEAKIHWRKCKPERGDVLYTKGGTTGLAKAIDFDTEVAVWVHIAVLKTNRDKVDPMWLENMLNTEYCYAQSQEFTHGIANRDLGLTRMVNTRIYVPPLTLQNTFASRVAEVRELKAAQVASRQRVDDLFRSLLHRAFQGEL